MLTSISTRAPRLADVGTRLVQALARLFSSPIMIVRSLAFVLALSATGFDTAHAQETQTAAAEAAPQPPSVSVVTATRREIVSNVVVTGTLVPRETVMIGSDVDGLRVEALLVDEGDEVKAGQVLARLATDLIDVDLARSTTQIARAEAAITQAGALVDEAQSAAVEADAALQRTRALNAKGIVGQDVLDQRVSAAAAANARLASTRQGIALAEADKAATEAERRTLEVRRSKAEIKAPTDGLVLARAARLGSVVGVTGGALFEVARDGLIELDAEVSETALNALSRDQAVQVTLAGGGPGIAGRIRLVSPKVDQATRLGRVRIALPASSASRSGAFARGVVETARSHGVVVPRTAVVSDEGKSSVQVVKDGTVETRAVELGIGSGDDIEVTAGLAEGESVISLAGTFVRDGDAVTPIGPDATKTAEAAR